MRELVLTGFKSFWPEYEKDAVFLGPWCFASNHKYKFVDQKKFNLARSPWETPDDILKASLYIDSLIDRIIPPLSKHMNNFNGVKYSEQFWKKYTIVWLTHWLGHCYDRYMRLKFLEYSNEDLAVKILYTDIKAAENFWDYMNKMIVGHYYNLLLMSDIIKYGQFKFLFPEAFNISNDIDEEKDIQESPKGFLCVFKTLVTMSRFLKSKIRAILDNLNSSLYLGNVYGISVIDKLYLQVSYDPFFLFKIKDTGKLHEIKGQRTEFIKQSFEFEAQNDFEKIIHTIILLYFPDAFLTMYYRKRHNIPKRKIWIGNDIYQSEKHAYRIALVCEHGGKWISAQHGGGYGQTLSLPQGKVEYETSNGFITWGWNTPHIYPSRYYPLASPKLSKLPKHREKKEQLVFVSTMHPIYFYRLHSILCPEDFLNYLNNKTTFFCCLSNNIRSKVKYRPYFYDYGVSEVEFISTLLSARQLFIKGNLLKEFQRSKLVVIDHMATSFLEAFAMNVPTILYWRPDHFVITPSAVSYFNRLRSAGILFDMPESAAQKVNEIWSDVQGWWQQQEVQNAKDDFSYQFARTSKNWRKEWAEFLKGLRVK